jgi:hypothetical protein
MAATGLMSSFTSWLSTAVSSPPSKFVLDCTAGFHRGVRIELEPGDIRIGSTPGADIVLRDAGIAAEHAVLRVGRRTIDLHAVGGEVRVGDEVIADGYGCALNAPVELTIGEARLRISVADQAPVETPSEPADAPQRKRFPVALLVGGALLIAVPALGLAAMRPTAPKAPDPTKIARIAAPVDANMSAADSSRLLADLPAADRQFIQNCLSNKAGISVREAIAELNDCGPQPSGNLGSSVDAEDAGRKLAERLTQSGLTGLRVSTGGGQVVVTGSVTKQQADAWTETQQWFDAAYRGRLVLVAKVTSTEAKKATPVLNVQAVWFGDHPYVLTSEGNRYYKGAFLDNGWMIKDIAESRILLTKDGETMALVYRQ